MPLAGELELPTFDHTDVELRGNRYRAAMAALHGHDGWLAAGPFGFIVLDREAGEFFLRTKDAVFPGLTIAQLFGISEGPLHEEIVKNIININLVLNVLVGGVDTSQSQLAHAVRLLASNPDQWQRLRSDPDGLALAAVDEALRFEPITPFTARITIAQVEHRGVTFPPGCIVLVSAWHANRRDVEPDGFDIARNGDSRRMLTFGAGIHYCVGANLARAEIQEGLAMLARRVRSIALCGEPVFGTPSGIYSLESLPVELELELELDDS